MKSTIAKSVARIWKNRSPIVAILEIIIGFIIGLGIAFGFLCLHAWILMLLWNWVAVSLFNAPVLNFWLAVGLSVLCSVLFKSFSKKNEKD